MKKLIILMTCLSSLLFGDIPEPYRSVKDLPFDNHGWFCNGRQLEHIISQRSPKIVIEIGSWLGSSTRFIASNIPQDGVVYAVDTWKGSQNEDAHLQDSRLPYLYHLFLSNVKHANLTTKIIPIRMESIEASKALNIQADLIYLDGAHDTPSVIEDIMNWYPHLNEGGLMCGDDWVWDSVQDAVIQCAIRLNKKVREQQNFWWYED